MKSFVIKSINLLLILAVLAGYNQVLALQSRDDEIARLSAELESSKLTLEQLSAAGQKKENGKIYQDGSYTGEAEGFGGTIQVEVEVAEGNIKDIVILSAEGEDGAYLTMAEGIVQNMIEEQSADVDTVSGATFSSGGIRSATEQALKKAEAEP